MTIENILFDVADALRYPVLIAAMLAVVVVVVELGALLAELRKRRRRGLSRLEQGLDGIRAALAKGDSATALSLARGLGYNQSMTEALAAIVEQRGKPDAPDRIAKRMAEYDYRSMRRLERTRILVRMGPALGLMGTLIPLSPALAALAEGDVQRLTEDLRVAFSVTVAGLLVGMIAFAISLVRDRLYAQDYSDVEYVLAGLSGVPTPPSPKAPPTGEAKVAATEVAQSSAAPTTVVLPASSPPTAPEGA
ncbi:MAG TPA: MotA/TolQ/ExbB proton channel family protein [Thermoleophilaceae bacterium]|nr:MotA/TolQ/ExbB proton channel family protein [Thermoleophilaceae bacterium]